MDIQRADPRACRRVIWILVVSAAAGAVLLLWFEHSKPGIRAWITERSDLIAERAGLLLVVIGVLLIGPLLAFSVYLWFLGRRIAIAQRYPLPSIKLIRDMKVVCSPAAEKRGRLVKAMALLLASLAIGLLSILWWLGNSLETSLQ